MSNDPTNQPPPRRLAVATYSGLAVVGLVAIALTGCGSQAPGSAASARLSSASAGSSGRGEPPSGTKAESRRLARHLLGKAVLPPGSRRFTGKIPSSLRTTGTVISATSSVDLSKVFADRWSMRRTFAFLKKHHAAGWSQSGVGSSYDTVHGKRVSFLDEVSYAPKRLPVDDDAISMNFEVVSFGHGHALVREDVQVIWYPARSLAEHLVPRDIRSVTIIGRYLNPHSYSVKRTFRQQAIIGKLARLLNSQPASPGGWVSCPAVRVQYELRFLPTAGHAETTIYAGGCFQYLITVGGHSQPPLVDNGGIEKISNRLLPHPGTNPSAPATPSGGPAN